MAIIKTIGEQDTGVSRTSEGLDVNVRSTRDGALFRADWKQAMIMEGRGFMFNLGTLSEPITGGGAGATTPDVDCPEFVVGVPSGTSIMPVLVEVICGLPVGAADDDLVEMLITVDQDKVNAQSSGTSGTAPTIYNMNTLHPRKTNCWCNQQYSATMTDPVNDLELAHVIKYFEKLSTAEAKWNGFELKYEPESLVIINGPAMLIGYFGGTNATLGFATVQWLEIPTSAL